MTNLIVAFSKPEDAKSIRNILVRNGLQVAAFCTTGAQVLQYADDLHSGIAICGFRLQDMIASNLRADLPEQFDLLLLASNRFREEVEGTPGLTFVSTPLKVHELMDAVERISAANERKRRRSRQQPRERSSSDKETIQTAKRILMEQRNLSEEDAYRYLQKTSMDNGVSMPETATMIMDIYRRKMEEKHV